MEAIFKLAAVYSVIDKLSGPVKTMAGNVTNLEKMMNKANGMMNFGTKIGLTGAMIGEAGNTMKNGMQSLIEPFAAVEDASAALKTVTITTMGSVEKSIKATQKAAIDWSKTHTDSAEKFISTSYMMASAGLNDVQAIEATKTAMTVAKATMGDSGEAASLIATLYNNMGDKTRDAGTEMQRLGDVVTKTQQTFQFKNLGQLTEGLKYAVPTALQFSMSIEEVNTVVGQLNNAGITGGQAGTAFAATMRQMNKASKDLGFSIARTADGGVSMIGTIENIRAKYGSFAEMTADQQEAFKQAFGDEGLRAISLLMDKTGDMNKTLKDITNSTGAATAAQKTMEDTVHGRATIAAQRLTALKIAFGEKLLGNKQVIDTIIPKFTSLVETIGNMILSFTESHPVLSSNIMLLFALGTGLLLLIAPILSVGSAFFVMAGHGMQGITKVCQAFTLLSSKISAQAIAGKMEIIQSSMTRGFAAGRAAVIRCATSMQTFILSMWRASAAAAAAGAQGLKRMTLALAAMARQAIMTAVTAIPAMIAAVWSFTVALLANPLTWIVIGIIALALAIYYCAKNWDIISAAAQNAWNVICAAFQSGLGWIRESLNGAWQWISGMATTFFTSGAALWEAFTQGIRSSLSGPATAVQEGLQWIRNMLPFSDAKEGPLSELTHNGQKLMSTIAAGVGIEAPKLHDAVADGIDVNHLFNRNNSLAAEGQSGGQKIVFQGPITIQVENMNKPEDFFGALKQFASEVGG